MAAQNALLSLEQARLEREAGRDSTEGPLKELAAALGLPGPPGRMECYDIPIPRVRNQ
ncbi:hypothetical protein N752_00740 [Desulforamulus aquiferis]|nr:hypothetical protein N752_00740 [Desulforamulus aquiferis]